MTRWRQKRKTSKDRRRKFEREYGSVERVEFVRSLPCMLAGIDHCEGKIDNAHTTNGGMGRKADYDTIVPVCRRHHWRLHNGLVDFCGHEIDLKMAAVEIERRWQEHLRLKDYKPAYIWGEAS